MKMGDGVEQAIHSVAMLSGLSEGGVLSAAALAEFHGVSTSYLLKHLQALSGAGILDTVPGPKGGYRLAKAPKEISLLDIVLAVEGP
ncbi:Rrf2 family transcriptional regulator, partial [Mesorhizobium sp. M1A.T.Ca.IN.004.03.1.1]